MVHVLCVAGVLGYLSSRLPRLYAHVESSMPSRVAFMYFLNAEDMDTTCSKWPSVISGGPPLLFCLESNTASATAVWKADFVRWLRPIYYWRLTVSNFSSVPLQALHLLGFHVLLRTDVVEDLRCATFVIVFQFAEQVVPYGLACVVIELFVAKR
jgi:hypothetical protein